MVFLSRNRTKNRLMLVHLFHDGDILVVLVRALARISGEKHKKKGQYSRCPCLHVRFRWLCYLMSWWPIQNRTVSPMIGCLNKFEQINKLPVKVKVLTMPNVLANGTPKHFLSVCLVCPISGHHKIRQSPQGILFAWFIQVPVVRQTPLWC